MAKYAAGYMDEGASRALAKHFRGGNVHVESVHSSVKLAREAARGYARRPKRGKVAVYQDGRYDWVLVRVDR